MHDTRCNPIAIRPRPGLAVVSVLIALGIGSSLARAQSDPVLTVQGMAEVQVPSDTATVRLGVVGQAATAGAAQAQVNRAAASVLAAVRQAGIEERQIQTSRLILNPVYSRPVPGGSGVPEIEAYRASNTVSIRVENLELLGDVLDAGLEGGANQLEGVSFGIRDDRPARERALRQAIDEAQAKATAMADALGVRLDGVISVDEGGVFVARPQMEMARVATLQADVPTPVAPGEITVSATVSVRYRISED